MVEAPVLATYNKPLVELTEAFEVARLKILPVVRALVLTDNGVCVLAVVQFHVCAKFKLLMLLVALAGFKEDSAPRLI